MNNNIEMFTTKESLLKHGIKSKLFYFRVLNDSYKRGYNRTISVHVLDKDMRPVSIGETHVNTASYKGDKATAINLISNIFGYKNDGYNLLDLKIKVFEI